jgi:hypothetical protein
VLTPELVSMLLFGSGLFIIATKLRSSQKQARGELIQALLAGALVGDLSTTQKVARVS